MVQISDFYFGQFVLRLSTERAGRYRDMTLPFNPAFFFPRVQSQKDKFRNSKRNHS